MGSLPTFGSPDPEPLPPPPLSRPPPPPAPNTTRICLRLRTSHQVCADLLQSSNLQLQESVTAHHNDWGLGVWGFGGLRGLRVQGGFNNLRFSVGGEVKGATNYDDLTVPEPMRLPGNFSASIDNDASIGLKESSFGRFGFGKI